MSESSSKVSDEPTEKNADHEESEEEDSDEEGNFVVEEIISVRVVGRGNKKLEFETRWQSDTSITWEPIGSFPNGFEHEEIVRFKTNHPEKYKIVEKFLAEKEKKKSRSHKNWTYVELTQEDEEGRYEKPDTAAKTREVKSLYDPNRLEDKEEAYLKSFDSGIRISRNAVRQLRESRGVSSESKSPKSSVPSTPQPQERKKKAPGGGKKKKTEEKAASPSQSPVEKTHRKRKSRSKNIEKPASPPKEEQAATVGSSLADGIDTWTPIRRAVKLNSSDSDSDFEQEKTPAKKRKSVERDQRPSNPQPKSSTSAVQEVKNKETIKNLPKEDRPLNKSQVTSESSAPESLKRARREEKQSTPVTQQPVTVEESKKDPDVYYAGQEEEDHDEDPDVVGFGLQLFRGNVKEHFDQQNEAFKSQQRIPLLADAILAMDMISTECILENIERQDAFRIIAQLKFPLHVLMENLYLDMRPRPHENFESKKKQVENMVRLVLHYLPIEVLRSQHNHENTLLHLAINIKSLSLTRFLLNIGSPLDIRNSVSLTAVESANLTKNSSFLDVVLKKGGTFHYMIDDFPVCFPYERDRQWLDSLNEQVRNDLVGTARNVYNMIDAFCRNQRAVLLPPSIVPQQFGPIVCCPRGKLKDCGINHSIRFRFPATEALFDMNSEYILAVVPMKFDQVEKKMFGKPLAPRMPEPPLLNNIVCVPIKPLQPYYNCTKSVHSQVNDPIIWSRSEDNKDPVPSPMAEDFKSVFTLDLLVDPCDPFDFLACQVMRVEYNSGGQVERPYSPSIQYAPSSSGPPQNKPPQYRRPGPPNNSTTYPRFNPPNNPNQQHRPNHNQPPPSSNQPYNTFSKPQFANNRPGPSNTPR